MEKEKLAAPTQPPSQVSNDAPSAPAPNQTTKSKWKTVEAKSEAFNLESAVQVADEDEEDVDGEPMADDDVDGEPMVDDDDDDDDPEPEREEMEEKNEKPTDGADDSRAEKPASTIVMQGFKIASSAPVGASPKGPAGPRKRMRAEDMFADEDESS